MRRQRMQSQTRFLIPVLALSGIVVFSSILSAQPGRPRTSQGKSQEPKTGPGASYKPLGQWQVAPIDRTKKSQIQQAARKIDQLVSANYQKYQVKPHPKTSDEQFVRRIYLETTGAIPTLGQAKSFMDSRDLAKREKLIDHLLESQGYVSHTYNYWADILRLKDRPANIVFGEPFIEWVKKSIAANEPYDIWVRAMMTAEGKPWENPAVGYQLRDMGMPLAAMDNTIRIFMGTQIGCAQCHDHPFDRWTQQEFYELAAMTFGARMRMRPADYGAKKNRNRELINSTTKVKDKGVPQGAINRMINANTVAVIGDPKVRLKYPHDYYGENAKPGEVVKPNFLFTSNRDPDPKRLRDSFAEWLTSKDNPRFSKTIANRLWKQAFGRGLIEPADDIRDDTVAENPELLDFLVRELHRSNFDLRYLRRVIYNTEVYQRQALNETVEAYEEYHFPGPLLRRMTAEQVWDSFLTMAVKNPLAYRSPSTRAFRGLAELDLSTIQPSEVIQKVGAFEDRYGGVGLRNYRKPYTYKGQLLARASEQPAPLPAAHFIRQFGQGDRESIEGGTTEGTVPQLLAMFNGSITHIMLEKGSVIHGNVLRAKSVNSQIDDIFLTILSRRPNSTDRKTAVREMQAQGAAGYGNVIWALVNTREFLFIQ